MTDSEGGQEIAGEGETEISRGVEQRLNIASLDEIPWRRLHPVSPLLRGGLAFIVVFGIVLANFRDQLVAFLFAQSFRNLPEGGEQWGLGQLFDYLVAQGLLLIALGIVLAVLLLIVALAWLSWRFLTFRVTEEAVEERSGIVFRQHRRAPIDRIQSVNLQRSLFARLLGMTSVEVSTGGSGGKVALRYLAHRDATQVRERILRIVSQQRSEHWEAATVFSHPSEGSLVPPAFQSPTHSMIDDRLHDLTDFDVDPSAEAAGTLVRVPIGRLIGSIALSREMLIIIVLVATVIVTSVWMSLFLLFMLLPLMIVSISLLIAQFNTGFNFVLSRSRDGIRVGAGLTSTMTETIPFGRIHAVEALQPLGWRPFGWWKMRVTTAGHAVSRGGQNRLRNTVLPVGNIDDVLRVFETVLPGSPSVEGAESLRDALIGPGVGYLRPQQRAIWVLGFAKARAGIKLDLGTEPTVRIRGGAITRKLIVMPIVRAQSVQLHRPAIHRLLGLATIQADTVLGPIRVIRRGLGLEVAQEFFDEFAHQVVRAQLAESERRSLQGIAYAPVSIDHAKETDARVDEARADEGDSAP